MVHHHQLESTNLTVKLTSEAFRLKSSTQFGHTKCIVIFVIADETQPFPSLKSQVTFISKSQG